MVIVSSWIINNKEKGKERCEIILRTRKNENSYVLKFNYFLEFKYLHSKNIVTKKIVREAINQIKTKQHSINLICYVIYISLAHYKKEFKIE